MSSEERAQLLVVDDAVMNTSLLEMAIPEYRILTADNGADAISLAIAHLPDLILLDVQLPDMDGFEVCRLLKQQENTRNIPVIFLTGMSEPGSIATGFDLGAADYITKPFDFAEVKARIRTHLNLCSVRRELERQNELLEEKIREQQLSIALSRNILGLVNSVPERYIDLDGRHSLFVLPLRCPCKEEGGDHFLVKTIPLSGNGHAKTVVSVKDQSGHAVNCVLRSIVTDLFHNALLAQMPSAPLPEVVSALNDRLISSGFLENDAFCTAMTMEIHHRDLLLEYVSAGHPPCVLIREGRARMLPWEREDGANLPLVVQDGLRFTSGGVRLQAGDRLLVYTDGLNELGAGNRPLQRGEMLALVEEADRNSSSVSETVRRLLQGLTPEPFGSENFRKNLVDDITLLAMEIETETGAMERQFLPREYECIDELIAAVAAMAQAAAGPAVDPVRLQMVVGEAVLNAWRHGNRENPDLPIAVRCGWGNDFNLEVIDRGEGFDPAGITDPRRLANRTRSTGRGIFIMKKVGDWVRWRDGGRRCVVSIAAGDLRSAEGERGCVQHFPLWKYCN